MKTLRIPPANKRDTIISASLLILGAVASITLLLCKSKKRSGKEYKFDPNEPVPRLPDTDPDKSDTFYSLQLSKKQYENLKGYGGSKLVFQFFYPQSSACGSPTLFAYKMKKFHRATGTSPEVLSYGKASAEPIRGRGQVLGDSEISISKLDDLIKRSTGGKKNDFSCLHFTPVFISSNPHVAYKISVDNSGSSEMANPCPPGSGS